MDYFSNHKISGTISVVFYFFSLLYMLKAAALCCWELPHAIDNDLHIIYIEDNHTQLRLSLLLAMGSSQLVGKPLRRSHNCEVGDDYIRKRSDDFAGIGGGKAYHTRS